MCSSDLVMQLSAKHPRREPMKWARLLNSRDSLPPVKVIVRPNLPVLRMMLDMDMDDRAVRGCSAAMISYEKEVERMGGEETVVYQQKSFAEFDHDGYDGSLLLGRAYTGSRLNHFKRRVLNTMFKQTHVELDLQSAMPTLLRAAFRHLRLPALDRYLTERSATVPDVKPCLVKRMVNAMIGAAPCIPADFGVGFEMVDEIRTFRDSEFVASLHADVVKMKEELVILYPGFAELVRRKCEKEGSLKHWHGSALSLLAQDMEHVVMRTVMRGLAIEDDVVWLYDGILVPRSMLSLSKMDEAVRMVREDLGFDILLTERALDGDSLAISLSNEEQRESNAYETWKRKFERRYFHCLVPPVDYRIQPTGVLQPLTQADFFHVASDEPKEFLKRWREDPKKRQYECVGCYPPPLVCPSSTFNTWSGLAAEDLPEVDDVLVPGLVKMYCDHVQLLVGGEERDAIYFHKLMAFKFQKPGFKWRVMPFIRSTPGVGKDSWFKFVEAIVGEKNSCRVARISDVMGNTSHLMENKLFVCFSECDYADGVRNMEDLKDIITSDRLLVKRKYVAEYGTTSTACYIAFSNNFNAFNISSDDRRFFAVTASGRYANDPAYHGPLIAYFNDPIHQRAVYQYYMSLDISDFDPSGERPKTDTFMELATVNITLWDRLLKSKLDIWEEYARIDSSGGDFSIPSPGVLRINTKLLTAEFQQLCEYDKVTNYDKPHAMSQFGGRLLREMGARIDKFKTIESWKTSIRYFRSNGRNYRDFDVEACRKYITNCLSSDMACDDDEDNVSVLEPQGEFHGGGRYTGFGK